MKQTFDLEQAISSLKKDESDDENDNGNDAPNKGEKSGDGSDGDVEGGDGDDYDFDDDSDNDGGDNSHVDSDKQVVVYKARLSFWNFFYPIKGFYSVTIFILELLQNR